jgi:hypothetical protein
MHHHIFVTLLLFILISFMVSCTRMHLSVDKALDSARIHTIQQNTPYADVLAVLGPPAKLTALPSGFAFLYESTQASQRGLSLSFFVPVFSVNISKGNRVLDAYVVVFNEHGLVVGSGQITKSVPLNFSLAVSLSTGGKFRELTTPAPQHHWGMSMLQPLSKTLNTANDVDAGMHGLEQRGTPLAVGQRTLEGPARKPRR